MRLRLYIIRSNLVAWLIHRLGHNCDALKPIGTATIGTMAGLPIERVWFEGGAMVVEFVMNTQVDGDVRGFVTIYGTDGQLAVTGQVDHPSKGIKTRFSTWTITDSIDLHPVERP